MQNNTAPRLSKQSSPTCQAFAQWFAQWFVAVSLCLMLGGCFNGENTLDLGSVSVGQQLIDLKKARDSGSMSEAEYQRAKKSILELLGDESDDDSDDHNEQDGKNKSEAKGEETGKEEEEEESSGFLF